MGKGIELDLRASGITPEALQALEKQVTQAHDWLHNRTGAGNDFLGWLDWPEQYDVAEFSRLKAKARAVRESADVLLVIGIGGSYLGAKAALEALVHPFYNQLSAEKRGGPEIYFLGQTLSADYTAAVLEMVQGKSLYVNVISKSGTTTEPALAFRLVRNYLIEVYGEEEANGRIIATTDGARGALKGMADACDFEAYRIPDDIGGRFSIFTPVGLFPMAVAGIDVDAFMAGALEGMRTYSSPTLMENTAYQYAALRYALHRQSGKQVEILVSYEPALVSLAEWWKQLFGESEGKGGNGLFPASVLFSTDLHSMGQYVQDGSRMLFETVLQIERPGTDCMIPHQPGDLDQLNFLAGESLHTINHTAFQGTLLAHVDGGCPNLVLTLPRLDAFGFGELLYFFMKACGISAYMLGVNPFDQPGVEAYKKNMFALLGKPGYEELARALRARL